MKFKAVNWFAFFAVATLTLGNLKAEADDSKSNRVFEMRTYYCNEGKLDALNARFRNHTNKLFQKHGIDLVGYWVPTDGEESKNTLVYIIAFPSRDAAKKSWQAFIKDPDWQAAYKASIKDGRLVKKVESKYLTPTDYSPIK